MTKTTRFDYNKIRAGYYDDVFKKGLGMQSKWHHLKFDYVKSNLNNYDHHLDIGCGPGTFIGLLDADKKSVGVDIAHDQISFAQKTYQSSQHQFQLLNDPAHLPFDDESFDAVTLIEVIEHLNDEEIHSIFKEVWRVLKPEGRILMTTPNYGSLWPVVEFILNKVSDVSYEEQHISLFTKSKLSRLLDERGYNDVEVNLFQWLAPFTAPIGWRFADKLHRWELYSTGKWFGFLLFGSGKKV